MCRGDFGRVSDYLEVTLEVFWVVLVVVVWYSCFFFSTGTSSGFANASYLETMDLPGACIQGFTKNTFYKNLFVF